MLKRSEIPIIKDGVLTLQGYSFGMVYRLIGICSNPGTYVLDKIKGVNWNSDGSSLWVTLSDGSFLAGSKVLKSELVQLLNDLTALSKSKIKYYDIEGTLFRPDGNKLCYLEQINSTSTEVMYEEHSIPMSVIFKILRPDFPTIDKKFAFLCSDRIDYLKNKFVTNDTLDSQLGYLGYTKVENYYVLITFDEVVRIDTIQGNKLKTFKTTLGSLKQFLIV